MDTLIWLVNFPVTHGYAMVFIAGFSLMGLFGLSFRGVGSGSKLSRVRASQGLPEADPGRAGRVVFAHIQRIGFRTLTVVMLAGLVLGILGLVGVPVTGAYIQANGQPAVATQNGDWITFTTSTGETYTLENNFFTPVSYPDRDAWFSSDEELIVRYLPDHPQAFIIDTTQSTVR